MKTKHLPTELFILIVKHLEPDACYRLIQSIHGLETVLPRSEFGKQTTRDGNTIMHFAAHRGDQRLIEYINSKGLDVNVKNHDGVTPLAVAARRGHESVVEFLISTGAEINVRDYRGLTPLHNAAHHGADRIVRILLDAGADPLLQARKRRTTALDWASRSGHVTTVALLLSRISKRPRFLAAMSIAAKNGRTAVLQQLIDADFQFYNHSLYAGASSGRPKVVKLLLSHGDWYEGARREALWMAVKKRSLSTVQELLGSGLRISNDDDLLLKALGHGGSLKILRALCHAGLDISESTDNDTKDMLLEAAARGSNTALVEYLAHLGWVNPDNGSYALFEAIRFGSSSVVKILLEHGFKLPLHDRNYDLVRKVINSGIDTSPSDPILHENLRLALSKAVDHGNTEIVGLLLGAGISPEAHGFEESDISMLYKETEKGHLEMVKLLVQAGADVFYESYKDFSRAGPGRHGYTALYIATNNGHLDVMKYLIQHGAPVSHQGAEDISALHVAVQTDCPSSVSLLLEAGANMSLRASCGGTPLHFAAEYGFLEAVQLLLDAGADPFVRNWHGQFPWDLALNGGHDDTVNIFEELVN
ncbi:uncharacterized protein N7496_012127 [Penicillium cataractarum]|uniref:Uncharacterized protein n=1 Tax=Penicillium cataractarum TaxID=2100454 RepID=A0A9W9RI33_9EURO|nr:uncharacterized protein N7496_012127 [Penicillium cataractarum]KAJ5359714.1 hypothetical protein N7496_012127 [Penicillium cataractarum]